MKSSLRFIPKRTYQVIAGLLLMACIGLTIESVVKRDWPFAQLASWLGEPRWGIAAILTFGVFIIGWFIVVTPLRLFSQMPTYKEELQAAGAKNFKELLQKQKQKLPLDNSEPLPPKEEAARLRMLAFGGIALGGTTALITCVIFLAVQRVWISGVLLTLVIVVLGIWNGIRSLVVSRKA